MCVSGSPVCFSGLFSCYCTDVFGQLCNICSDPGIERGTVFLLPCQCGFQFGDLFGIVCAFAFFHQAVHA